MFPSMRSYRTVLILVCLMGDTWHLRVDSICILEPPLEGTALYCSPARDDGRPSLRGWYLSGMWVWLGGRGGQQAALAITSESY